jgi:DNA polymerase V
MALKKKIIIHKSVDNTHGDAVLPRLTVQISSVPAGFPSPAADFSETPLDLNKILIEHPASTFFVRVMGSSMVDAGIITGDVLVVDRSLTPQQGSIVLAVIDGSFTVKRYTSKNGKIELVPENGKYAPIVITDGMEVEIWGVVTYVIHKAV